MAAAVARAIRAATSAQPLRERLLSQAMLLLPCPSRLIPIRFWANESGSNFVEPLLTKMAPLFCCADYEHWLILMDKPGGEGATDKQIVRRYLRTLAKVVANEDEAFKKIYKVSLEGHLGFGCEIDEETSNKLKGLPGVRMVLPDPEYNYCGGKDGQFIPKSSVDELLSQITENLLLLATHVDHLEVKYNKDEDSETGKDDQFITKSDVDEKLSQITEKLKILSEQVDQLEKLAMIDNNKAKDSKTRTEC